MPEPLPALAQPSLVQAHVAHCLPGRVRLRIPAQRGAAAWFQAAEQRLAGLPGVAEARANPRTASVVLCHDRGLSLPDLAEHARAAGLFAVTEPPARPEAASVARRVVDGVERLDAGLRRSSGGWMDVPSLALLTLGTAGLVQVARGNVRSEGLTLLWWAVTTLVSMHSVLNRKSGAKPG